MEQYLKYYSLEDYLFVEVNNNFKQRGCLAPEEFFAIVIWKSNRAKTKVLNGLRDNKKTIEEITKGLSNKTEQEKLAHLCQIKGVGIPVASAILAVCCSDNFTVVDYRAYNSLKSRFGVEIQGNPSYNQKAYFEYLNACKAVSKKQNLSLRDLDRMLWGMDFYEGIGGLKELANLYSKNLER